MSRDVKADGDEAPRSGSTSDRPPLEIAIERISKRFPGEISALSEIDLTIRAGERLVVLGPSGSGKSTLLRIVAGLEPPTGGRVVIGKRDQADVPPHRRDVAMIFQNPALFPHLSVFENLAFGLRARKNDGQVAPRVVEIAAMLGLSYLLDRRPESLSGGERQRVAIGRAIAWRPRILLLDEPFSSLDAPLRGSLRDEVLAMHRRLGMTLIHVTHDQGEALAMADRVAILDRGRLVQCDTPRRIYERPAHQSVGAFVGIPPLNLLPCEIVREPDRLVFRLAGASSIILGASDVPGKGPFATLGVGEGRRLDLGIRPECVGVQGERGTSTPALVERIEYQGHETWFHLRLGGHILRSRETRRSPDRERDAVQIVFDFAGANWFDPATGLAMDADEIPFAEAPDAC